MSFLVFADNRYGSGADRFAHAEIYHFYVRIGEKKTVSDVNGAILAEGQVTGRFLAFKSRYFCQTSGLGQQTWESTPGA